MNPLLKKNCSEIVMASVIDLKRIDHLPRLVKNIVPIVIPACLKSSIVLSVFVGVATSGRSLGIMGSSCQM